MSVPASQGRPQLEALATESGFSPGAVDSMLRSIVRGGGRMAQFDHREFGGSGQWMQGGMLMISDLSNDALKQRVGSLCEALAAWVEREPAIAAGGSRSQSQTAGGVGDSSPYETTSQQAWYPASLGTPSSSGSQDRVRYAWFADARRLAIDEGAGVRVYDTGDHRIGGVSQAQGVHGSVSFTSQHGAVDVDRLRRVDVEQGVLQPGTSGDDRPAAERAPQPEPRPQSESQRQPQHEPQPQPRTRRESGADAASDPFVALEKLADLHARGIVDAGEFAAKKAELLKRI